MFRIIISTLCLISLINEISCQSEELNGCTSETNGKRWTKVVKLNSIKINKDSIYPLIINELKDISTCAKELKNYGDYIASHSYIANFYTKMEQWNNIEKHLDIMDVGINKYDISKQDYYAFRAEREYLYASYYTKLGWKEKALESYQNVINIFLEEVGHEEGEIIDLLLLGPNFSNSVSSVFNNLGHAYYEFGDYEKANEYFKISIELRKLKKRDVDSNIEIAINIQNSCKTYVETGEYISAELCYQDVIQHLNNLNESKDSNKLGQIYKNTATYYHKINDKENTFKYIKLAKEYISSDAYKIYFAQDISKIYIHYDMYDEAQKLLDDIRPIISSYAGEFHYKMALHYECLHDLELKKGNKDLAHNHINKALNIFQFKEGDQCDCSNYSYQNVNQNKELLEILRKKSNLLHENNQSQEAVQCYRVINQINKRLQNKFIVSEESKLFYSKRLKSTYEEAIQIAIEAGDKESAYQFSKESRALLLMQKIQQKEARNLSNIPSEIIEKGNEIELNIYSLRKERDQLLVKNDLEAINKINKELFSLNNSLENWEKEIAIKYPNFVDMKLNNESVSLHKIQQQLKKQQSTLIEYFLGDEDLYIFVIDENDINILSHKITDEINENISTLYTSINRKQSGVDNYQNFSKSSHYLYQLLIGGIDKKEWINNKNLIIIPDEQLNLIPFEALISNLPEEYNQVQFHKLDYLIKNHNISYHYTSNLTGNSRSKGTADKDFIGISPTFSARHGIEELPFSQDETNKAAALYQSSELLQEENASSKNILEQLKDYRIAHFATHAIFNDSIPLDSRIELADTSLYIYEIFNIEHQLDLAIISACETAAGKQRKGEGVISLSRAFIQSGCPSVIASLWSVSDQKTSILMNHFHTNISEGKTVSESLSDAKRKYINEAVSKNVHPFYWAGFIQIGDSGNVENSTISWWIYTGILLFLVIGFFFVKQNKKE